jgi:hypothetical protein
MLRLPLARVLARFAASAICAALVSVAFAAPAAPASPGDLVLRVGAGRADITPEPEVLNWVTGKPYGTVLDRLCVQTLLLDDGTTKAAVIRWDLVDVSESARDEVRRVVGAALGMPGANIMINASHNHSAPWSPAYGENRRGRERDTWWAIRHMPAQNDFPPFKRWMARLLEATVESARQAEAQARPASLHIGRIAAYEYLHNRRPRTPAWGLAPGKQPAAVGVAHRDWVPEVAQGGASFGALDRTLALVAFRAAADEKPLAALYHLACHAVSIYPSTPALSADWPGATTRTIGGALGAEALYLQGCTGDINPWRRGPEAVAQMADGLARKAETALRWSVRLQPQPLRTARTVVALPLTPVARQRLGAETVEAEIQVIACGPLALVALPGEPMTELGLAIRERSPFPQTLVLGYSNGNGAHYVGMPGEKARGGYETTAAGAGTDECGTLMVEAATRLLGDVFAASGYRTK